MTDENLYNLTDEKINEIEKKISHAEIDSENSEQFLDAVFPNLSEEEKATIALFSVVFAETFGEDDSEEESYTEN